MEYFDPLCREVSKQCQYWAECWGGDGTVEQGQVMAKGNPNGTCGEQKGPSEEEEEEEKKKKKKRDEETPVLLSTRTPQLTDDDVPPFDEPFCLCKYGAEDDDMGDKTLTQDACTHVPDSQYFVYENSAGDLQGGVRSFFFLLLFSSLPYHPKNSAPSPRAITRKKKKKKNSLIRNQRE